MRKLEGLVIAFVLSLSIPLAAMATGGEQPKTAKSKTVSPEKRVKKALTAMTDDLKKSKNLEKHEKTLTELRNDSACQSITKIYTTINETQVKQYKALNQKMYLKQKVDTATYFDLCRRMFTNLEMLDSIEQIPNKKGKVELKHRKQSAQQLDGIRPHLFTAGIFFLRQGKYQDAYTYFNEYIHSANMPLMKEFDYQNSDTLLTKAAYWACYSGYKLNNADVTLAHSDLAYRDTATNDYLRQYIAHAYFLRNDTANSIRVLREGFDHNPSFPFFYPRLIQYYNGMGNNEQAMEITNEALKHDSLNEQFLYTKSALLLAEGKNRESLIISEYLIGRNDSLAEAYYNAATAVMNMNDQRQAAKRTKKKRQLMKEGYTKAKGYLEKYRALKPDEKKKWAAPLYRVYYNLNMGKELSEVEKYLK